MKNPNLLKLFLLAAAFWTGSVGAMDVYRANEVKPYQAPLAKPVQGQTLQPYRADTIAPEPPARTGQPAAVQVYDYVGKASNGPYSGNMTLRIKVASGRLSGQIHWSDGLEGDADVSGRRESAHDFTMTGTVYHRGQRYPITLRGKNGDGRIQGGYELDLGGTNGIQQGEFKLTRVGMADPSIDPKSAPAEPTPAGPKPRSGNPVEPLSNGLALTMTRDEILAKFGPAEPNWDRCMLQYGGFHIVCGGARQGIWHLKITSPAIALNSGIRVGDSRQDVARVFGNPHGGVRGQYKLDFGYDGDRLARIAIDPAESEFRVQADDSGKTPPTPAPSAAPSALVGLYWCVAPSWSKGTIDLLPDGHYRMNGANAGRYTVGRDQVRFDGSLSTWNNGVARIENGNLIFEWKNADGAMQYFAYQKGN